MFFDTTPTGWKCNQKHFVQFSNKMFMKAERHQNASGWQNVKRGLTFMAFNVCFDLKKALPYVESIVV